MKRLWLWFSLAALAAYCTTAWAFNGHRVTEGPLTIHLSEIPLITNHFPQAFTVTLSNAGPATLTVNLEMFDLVDTCRAMGKTALSVSVPPGSSGSANFQFLAGEGTYSALYPLHVRASFHHAGEERLVHAIRIFETDFFALEKAQRSERPLESIQVPLTGVVPLAKLKSSQAQWKIFKAAHPQGSTAPGWQGTDPATGASFFRSLIHRGESRQSFNMHPPYRTGPGTVSVAYRLKLPKTTPITLEFFNAIRDHSETEPPSDGVTFRVWVDESVVFERHTDSKTWLPATVQLQNWAGKEIGLCFEADPGPKQDTTCDSGFWGDPVVRTGPSPRVLTEAEQEVLQSRARAGIRDRRTTDEVFVFDLGSCATSIAPGPNGLFDAAIAFGDHTKSIIYSGLNISVDDQPIGPGGFAIERVTSRMSAGKLRIVHTVALPDGPAEILAEAWRDGPALRLKISSSARLSHLSLKRADQPATAVYYGHGYCIVDPGKFSAGGGGHDLSTSHVGFDFTSGISLLLACSTPPDILQIDPPEKIYTLVTHPATTFTFLPGTNGAMACAANYRAIYDRNPAPAVARKAGRFVFDLWGGKYADNTRLLQQCFDYGLTNSLVLMHDWQRWGYDYRLPDIFPPQPRLGTLEDLRNLGETCKRAGVLWGLHDNYIDFYPDATGFSYDHVTFDSEGRPRKAWLNEGRNAQSYQFRPDHVRPFLERNLNLIAPALKPTASFVDVWTSLNAFDYYDRNGNFHSKMETLRHWGESFNRIRDAFNSGPTISEAGSDQLIGWLDGADCQFLNIGQGRFNLRVPCRDWARVPWFDLVNHTRFSLHGVGYSGRYQGGRSREEHGIESDDYLSAEILTGHALMIDLPGLVRGAVRKYWLAQDFIESVAFDEMAAVHILDEQQRVLNAPGNGAQAPHRIHMLWSSGAEVWVNRATNDWHVAGKVLPPFGYYARNKQVESSIERIAGLVVEQSRAPGKAYVNGRGFDLHAPLAITPHVRSIHYSGGREFKLLVDWQADEPAPKDLAVFYHFRRELPDRYTDVEFYGGGMPPVPTSKWKGTIETGTNWHVRIPEGMPPGQYDVLVGLFDARGDGRRYRMHGKEVADTRYLIGKLVIEGSINLGVTNISEVRLEELPKQVLTTGRTNPRLKGLVPFGAVTTSGAVRLVTADDTLTIIPLPDSESFELRLDLSRLHGSSFQANVVHAIDSNGTPIRKVDYKTQNGQLTLTCEKGVFGYRVQRQP